MEKMVEEGLDLIVGFKKYETFGTISIFGIDVIFVEVLKDVSSRNILY
ncbi:MAG: acetate--CoA ligase family protein [Thermosulfidibacteraceae bacterium]